MFLPVTSCAGPGKPFVPKSLKITSQFVFLTFFCLVTQNDDTKTETTFETISIRFLCIIFCQQDSIPAHSKRAALKLLSLSQSLDPLCCWNHSWSWLNPALCCGMNWAGKLRYHQQFCCASMDICIDQQIQLLGWLNQFMLTSLGQLLQCSSLDEEYTAEVNPLIVSPYVAFCLLWRDPVTCKLDAVCTKLKEQLWDQTQWIAAANWDWNSWSELKQTQHEMGTM